MSSPLPKRSEYIVIQLDPVASLERLDDPVATETCRALKPNKYLACVVQRLPAIVGIPVQLFLCLASVRGMVPGPDKFLIPEMCLPLSPSTHPWDRLQLTSEPSLPWPGLDCFLMTLASVNVLTEYAVEDSRLHGKYTQPDVADLGCSITFDKDWRTRLDLGGVDLASGDPNAAMHRAVEDDDSFEFPAHWKKNSANNDDAGAQHCSSAEKADPIQEHGVDANTVECRTDADSDSSSSSSSSIASDSDDADLAPSVKTASVEDKVSEDPRRSMPFVHCWVDLETIPIEEIGNPWDFKKEIEVLNRLEEESKIRMQEKIKAVANMDAELDVVVKRTRSLLSLTKKSDSGSDDSINAASAAINVALSQENEEVSVDARAPRDADELAAPLASTTREESNHAVDCPVGDNAEIVKSGSSTPAESSDPSTTKKEPRRNLRSLAVQFVSQLRIYAKSSKPPDSKPHSKEHSIVARISRVPSRVIAKFTRVWR